MNVKINNTMTNQNATDEQTYIHDQIQAEIIGSIKKFTNTIRRNRGDLTYETYDTDDQNKYKNYKKICDIIVDMQINNESQPIYFIEIKSTRATSYRKTLRQIVKYKANEFGIEKWRQLWFHQLNAKNNFLYDRQGEIKRVNSKWWFIIGVYQDEPESYYDDHDKLMTQIPLIVLAGEDGRAGGYQYGCFDNIKHFKSLIGAYSISNFDTFLPIKETLEFDKWDYLPNNAIFTTKAENDDQQTLSFDDPIKMIENESPEDTIARLQPVIDSMIEPTPEPTPAKDEKKRIRFFKKEPLTNEEKQAIKTMFAAGCTYKSIYEYMGTSSWTFQAIRKDPSYPDHQFLSELFNDKTLSDIVKPLGFWARIIQRFKHWFS